jgi:Flp pilus assembly protein TadD
MGKASNEQRSRLLGPALCGVLLAAVGLVFLQTAGFEFVNYDDPSGVRDNPQVIRPLTYQGLIGAFTGRHVESWAPLTCVSHMLVWHLLGHDAAYHHLVNVVLHAAAAVVLLLVLWRMTGRMWPSALAAAIFAVHPLRAESVAWVTERKDVLSGVFFMVSLAAYLRYARAEKGRLGAYLALLASFVVSLAAKPMAVTLPFLLLLLDYWPLGRFGGKKEGEQGRGGEGEVNGQPHATESPPLPLAPSPALASSPSLARRPRLRFGLRSRIIWEKIPLLILAGLFCLVTVHGQEPSALAVNRQYGVAWRIGNALVSYVTYLVQFFCPLNLVPAYPRRSLLPPWQVALATLTLVAITALAVRWRRQRPYLLVGWLWYVGMLVPVIGLVQFGAQAEADRFTYLPQIGLCIALAWGAAEMFRPAGSTGFQPAGKPGQAGRATTVCAVGTALALAVLIGWGWRQTRLWRSSRPLWTHAILCTPESAVAHDSLGSALSEEGRLGEAVREFREALRRDRRYVGAYNNLGAALARSGQLGEAMDLYRQALAIDPGDAEAHHNLGNALAMTGKGDEAIKEYATAVKLRPWNAEARYHLGVVLKRSRPDEAVRQFEQAILLSPGDARAYNDLANLLTDRGRLDDAIELYRRAVAIRPSLVQAQYNFGLALLQKNQIAEALRHFRLAVQFGPKFVPARDKLGAIYEAQHHDDKAAVEYRQALAADAKDLRALRSLAWIRATSPDPLLRNGDEAVALARRANEISGGKLPEVLDVLAAAYAEVGRFDDAASTLKRAVELAEQQRKEPLTEALRGRLACYRQGLPFRHQ